MNRALAPATFRCAVDPDGTATLTLDRPDRLNALTFDVYRELGEVFRLLADEPAVRAVVLTGAGRGFCSGGDVHDIIGELVQRDAAGLRAFCELTAESVRAMRALGKPIVAAVNGAAVGGGAALALAADLRWASTEARFGFVFARLGLSAADMGVTWLLPRLVGLGRASELLYTGAIVDAAAAERMGLVNRVVPPEALLPEARALAASLAQGSAAGLAGTKRMLDAAAALDWEAALGAESELQAELMAAPDFKEGHRAFVEKRPPRFGRG
jgi:enoyl-CoA hydratase/carnithine racemase